MWLPVGCPGHGEYGLYSVYGLYVHWKQELGGGGASLEGSSLTQSALF